MSQVTALSGASNTRKLASSKVNRKVFPKCHVVFHDEDAAMLHTYLLGSR
jgi:hypothetical protein